MTTDRPVNASRSMWKRLRTTSGVALAALLLLASSSSLLAGGGPCNYLVLYDQNDADSVAVANYYQQVRCVPERNMVPYTFFPAGRTTFSRANLWDLVLYLRQVVHDRGLAGRFNGIAIAGTVPLMGTTGQLSLPCALFYSPNATNAAGVTDDVYPSPSYRGDTGIATEFRDDTAFQTNKFYWPVSFVGFTGLGGNTPEEIFALIDRSKAADGTRVDGVIYWPTNSNIRSYAREYEMADVTNVWKRMGIRYLITPGNWVTGRPDIGGEIVGSTSADDGLNGNAYLPGSWADHLTSIGGRLNLLDPGQEPCSFWIRAGACGSSGTAAEPYVAPGKFPHAHIHTFFRQGATLGEAFWESISFLAETVCLGDPMMQPWAYVPQVDISSPTNGATLSGMAAIAATASTEYAGGLEAMYELAIDGHIVRTGASNETMGATWTGSGFTLDTTTLADGWHDLRVIAYDANPVRSQGEARRTVFVANSGGSVTLSGSSTVEYTSNATFTVALSGLAGATNVTIQANGRTLSTLPVSGGTTNLAGTMLGYHGRTELYAIAWLSGGRQVWSAPLPVDLTWAPIPSTNVVLGASVAALRYFDSTKAPDFSWETTAPTLETNYAGYVSGGYRQLATHTNGLPACVPSSWTNRPGFEVATVFLVPDTGLYHILVKSVSLTNLACEVDGRPFQHGTASSEGNIKPAPLKLAAGAHSLRMRFMATAANYSAQPLIAGMPPPTATHVQYYAFNEQRCFGPVPDGNLAPVVTNITFTPKTSTRTNVMVWATDPDGGPQPLTYSWLRLDGPGEVVFTPPAAWSTEVTLRKAGRHRLQVNVSDGAAVTTQDIAVDAMPIYGTVSMFPSTATIRKHQSVLLAAYQSDQFGTRYTDRPFVWSATAGAVSNGFYTAPGFSGTNRVTAAIGSLSATSTVTAIDNFPPSILGRSLEDHGDFVRCAVEGYDDLGTTNLTYTWEVVGTPPGSIALESGWPTNSLDAFFTRFGPYTIRTTVTDSDGASDWVTNAITTGPTLSGYRLADDGGSGVLDANEWADLYVGLYRGSAASRGTATTVRATLAADTNTVDLVLAVTNCAYPDIPAGATATNPAPFRLYAMPGPGGDPGRDILLNVGIGGASGTLSFGFPHSYLYTLSTGAVIVPGTNDLGLHSLSGGAMVDLPFSFPFYNGVYGRVWVDNGGTLQFVSSNTIWSMPWDSSPCTNVIAPYCQAQYTTVSGFGVYTSVSGTAPDRVFNIEWRTYAAGNTNTVANYEARLYESNGRIDFVYGRVDTYGAYADVGVLHDKTKYTEYSSRQAVIYEGLMITFNDWRAADDQTQDVWMLRHFGHTDPQSGDLSRPDDDPDGDGSCNQAEYLAGTDPTNDTSAFCILRMDTDGGTNTLEWYAGTNSGVAAPCSVQARTNLVEGEWQTEAAGLLRDPDGTNRWRAGSAPANTPRLYRVTIP